MEQSHAGTVEFTAKYEILHLKHGILAEWTLDLES